MENVKSFFDEIWKVQILNSVIIIIVSLVLYKSIVYILRKGEQKNTFKLSTSKKRNTYIKLIKSIIRYLFISVTILILLQVNGIDVSSVLAGVGILGVVFGLAIQDWLKDIIRGSSILSDNYFAVGDIVKYREYEGKVLEIGLKTTKIQQLKNNNIISIANRNIEEIELVSNFIYIDIPMPYELSVERAEKIVTQIIKLVEQVDDVKGCQYLGVNDIGDSSIKYQLKIECNTLHKLQVRRDTLRCILVELDKNKIPVPYTQIDVHQK